MTDSFKTATTPGLLFCAGFRARSSASLVHGPPRGAVVLGKPPGAVCGTFGGFRFNLARGVPWWRGADLERVDPNSWWCGHSRRVRTLARMTTAEPSLGLGLAVKFAQELQARRVLLMDIR